MAPDPLLVLSFTVVPFFALLAGTAASLWYAREVDSRLFVGTALVGLMGAHQLTELWLLATGGNPVGTVPGELFETSVNLLAVGTVLVLARRLETKQRRVERQAVLTSALTDTPIPGEDRPEPTAENRGLFSPKRFSLPIVGRFVSWAFTSLPLGTTANLSAVIETAARNLQVTYPATEVTRTAVPDLTVFAEATTLEDSFETVLKQLVVYNDSSEPTIHIDVENEGPQVTVRISDNGPGLPDPLADQLKGTGDTSVGPALELGAVHQLIEKWGGSIGVTDGAVELTLLSPQAHGGASED